MNYRIVWEIDMDSAANPEEAARKALDIQRDSKSIATVFTITDDETGAAWKVDLDAEPENRVTRVIEVPL